MGEAYLVEVIAAEEYAVENPKVEANYLSNKISAAHFFCRKLIPIFMLPNFMAVKNTAVEEGSFYFNSSSLKLKAFIIHYIQIDIYQYYLLSTFLQYNIIIWSIFHPLPNIQIW